MNRNQLISSIYKYQKRRQDLRAQERQISTQTKNITMQPIVSDKGDLRGNLSKILPKHLVPTNLGKYREMLSPFWYKVVFELGDDFEYTANFNRERDFQVIQEKGFLLTTISRAWRDYANQGAGYTAPVAIDIRDNQSTRQFNEKPIPLNSIGSKSRYTEIETPLLFQPNASVKVTMSSLIKEPADWSWPTVGDGYQEIVFGGYHIAMTDERFLAETILL